MTTNNCFRTALAKTGLNADMQDNGSDAAYILLAAMADSTDLLIAADANPDDVYGNAIQEVLHRLKRYTGFGYRRLARLLCDYDSSVTNVL